MAFFSAPIRRSSSLRFGISLAIGWCVLSLPQTLLGASFNTYYVDTARLTYTGTVTQYNSLANAVAQTNPLGDPSLIPDRPADFVTNPALITPYRDLILVLTHNSSFYQDATYILTNWYNPSTSNPGNTNLGFIQYYNDPVRSSTYGPVLFDTHNEAYFTGHVGSVYTEMYLHVAGANAVNTSMRLWEGPSLNARRGTFHTWDLEMTLFGLNGVEVDALTHLVGADNQPTSALGTLTGVFEPAVDPGKFYRFDYTISTDNNWLFEDPSNSGQPGSYFYAIAVPEPSTVCLAACSGLLILKRRRRTAIR